MNLSKMKTLTFLQQAGSNGLLHSSKNKLSLCQNAARKTLPLFRRASFRATAPEIKTNDQTITERSPVDKYLEAGLGVVVLKRGKARLFRDGRNPMVYAGAVERHIPPKGRVIQDCDPVVVCDGALSCVGLGFFNSHSMFRVRLLRHLDLEGTGNEPNLPWDFEADIVSRLENAVALRASIGIPSEFTNVYRLVNGEGDRLSGLVVDRVDNSLVVSSSALWCETYKDCILRSLSKVLPLCQDVIWRRNIERLRQDGLVTETDDLDAKRIQTEEHDENSQELVVVEAGVKYSLSRFALTRGQKTGHYADQRENRVYLRNMIQQLSEPCQVLDLFCYSGGFALNAALGNEQNRVIAVDSSTRALDMARRNAELNNVSERVEFIHSDVMKYLKGCSSEERESFDVVVMDPPKFAPNVKALPRATHKYRSLNAAAISMIKRGGLLCTCTCSAAMTQDRRLFVETIRNAAADVGREITLLKTLGAAADHPVTPEMMELEYLTMCIFVCR